MILTGFLLSSSKQKSSRGYLLDLTITIRSLIMPQKRKKKTTSTRRRKTSLKSPTPTRRRKKERDYWDEIEEGIEFGYTAGEIVADIIVGIFSFW